MSILVTINTYLYTGTISLNMGRIPEEDEKECLGKYFDAGFVDGTNSVTDRREYDGINMTIFKDLVDDIPPVSYNDTPIALNGKKARIPERVIGYSREHGREIGTYCTYHVTNYARMLPCTIRNKRGYEDLTRCTAPRPPSRTTLHIPDMYIDAYRIGEKMGRKSSGCSKLLYQYNAGNISTEKFHDVIEAFAAGFLEALPLRTRRIHTARLVGGPEKGSKPRPSSVMTKEEREYALDDHTGRAYREGFSWGWEYPDFPRIYVPPMQVKEICHPPKYPEIEIVSRAKSWDVVM